MYGNGAGIGMIENIMQKAPIITPPVLPGVLPGFYGADSGSVAPVIAGQNFGA